MTNDSITSLSADGLLRAFEADSALFSRTLRSRTKRPKHAERKKGMNEREEGRKNKESIEEKKEERRK
jgi:hypothetical protein